MSTFTFKRKRGATLIPVAFTGRKRRVPVSTARFTRARRRTGGFTGIELKFYDTSLVGNAIAEPTDASGAEVDPSATIALNTVTQGDGESQRDGRRMSMASIHIKGRVTQAALINQAQGIVPGNWMVALVLDKQTNGAQLNSEDVFTNPAASANLAIRPFRNLQFQDRFRVLAIRTGQFKDPSMTHDGTNIEVGGMGVNFEMNVALKGMKTTFTGTTETIANITDNSLHMIAYQGGAALLLNYNSRLRFRG